MTQYDEYANDISTGKITSCIYVKQAVKRYYRMLKDERYVFRPKKVQLVIDFFSILKHSTGKHNEKKFKLEPWQQLIIANIYGFYFKSDENLRVVTSAYIEMSRKQGKTAFAAGLSLYHLTSDGESGAEVDLAANSKDQAEIAFNHCKNFADSADPKHQLLKHYVKKIKMPSTKSVIHVFAADATKLDGFNASMYVIDEFHAAPNARLRDVLESSQGMRTNPLELVITTAGFDKDSECYKMRTAYIEMLAGVKENDRIFAIIYTIDEKDDWKNPDLWIKFAPNIGVTVNRSWIQSKILKLSIDPSIEVNVKTKVANIWCDSEEVWIPEKYIHQATRNINLEEFRDKIVYAGIDLSSTSDLTALSLMYINDAGKPIFKTYYFLPEEALDTKKHKIKYGDWKKKGLLIITPGNVTDYDYILNILMEIDEIAQFYKIAYDSWNSTQFVIKCLNLGLPMESFSQTIGNFNRPTKELERLMLKGGTEIDNNEITRFCFANAKLKHDWNGNAKPVKTTDDQKIDGLIAMLEALGIYLITPEANDTL